MSNCYFTVYTVDDANNGLSVLAPCTFFSLRHASWFRLLYAPESTFKHSIKGRETIFIDLINESKSRWFLCVQPFEKIKWIQFSTPFFFFQCTASLESFHSTSYKSQMYIHVLGVYNDLINVTVIPHFKLMQKIIPYLRVWFVGCKVKSQKYLISKMHENYASINKWVTRRPNGSDY